MWQNLKYHIKVLGRLGSVAGGGKIPATPAKPLPTYFD
jgi:hypothetical protein